VESLSREFDDDDEKGALIGKSQRRGDATKVIAEMAYQPEPKW